MTLCENFLEALGKYCSWILLRFWKIKCQDKLNISIKPLKIVKIESRHSRYRFRLEFCIFYSSLEMIVSRCDDFYEKCLVLYFPLFPPFFSLLVTLRFYLSFRYISASLLPLLCHPNLYSQSLPLLFFHCSFLFLLREQRRVRNANGRTATLWVIALLKGKVTGMCYRHWTTRATKMI